MPKTVRKILNKSLGLARECVNYFQNCTRWSRKLFDSKLRMITWWWRKCTKEHYCLWWIYGNDPQFFHWKSRPRKSRQRWSFVKLILIKKKMVTFLVNFFPTLTRKQIHTILSSSFKQNNIVQLPYSLDIAPFDFEVLIILEMLFKGN